MRVHVKKRENLLKNKGKMSTGERQVLEEKRSDLRMALAEMKENESTVGDKSRIEKEVKEIEMKLGHDDESSHTSPKERDVLQARKLELAEQIKKVLPPMRLQRAKDGTPEYDTALSNGAAASDPAFVNLCRDYQDVSRRLEPGNPQAGDLEAVVGW